MLSPSGLLHILSAQTWVPWAHMAASQLLLLMGSFYTLSSLVNGHCALSHLPSCFLYSVK